DLRSNRVGIVGPNGCGKSNIIDAVRWVMGESSAKQLRGESMADVIFNGSVGRPPVGQASVELVFDNAEGRLGGEYAAFSEIAVKRHVGREGESSYFLNNARCRRKDITDIFLGTGLGARSYAIIEQGMISRLIEAKPEDLRVFLEEAAGISKYKERRRETETRLRHTRENLERLTDLREELQKQLLRLEKQAEAARTYKELKTTLRQVSAEHLALKWRGFDEEMTAQQRLLAEQEILLEKKIAALRQLDAEIETARAAYEEAQENLQDVQSQYYRSNTEVSQREQTLAHQRERQAQFEMDLAQIKELVEELQQVLAEDEQQWQAMQSQVFALTPQASQLDSQYQHSYQILGMAEVSMQTWQSDWDKLMQDIARMQQNMQLGEAQSTHLQDKMQSANERLSVLNAQYAALEQNDVAQRLELLSAQCQESEVALAFAKDELTGLQQQFNQQHTQNETAEQQLEVARAALQTLQNESVSLQALQQAAWGDSQEMAMSWLTAQQLTDKQRLAQQLVVEPEWICAVETVLGDYLQAICVDK
ncbi:MAG TPA: AAA family ATPase, partial [Gammaproteobacteria bacterium]|nr:AAA family ATPase [Gammaproteobacteria bacterium]